MPDLNCTVNNCQYWTNGNLCTAQQIVIQADDQGGFPPDAQLSQLNATPSQTSSPAGTCCQTFKPKS